MSRPEKDKPRTLIIYWKKGLDKLHGRKVFSRVKSIEAAKAIVAKRPGRNIDKAVYIDVEGTTHDIHIKK